MKQLHNKTATESGKSVAGSRPETTHEAFEWLRSQPIDSLNIVVEEYRHMVTGAQHIHLVSDNPENVFLVALRTVPTDSTGVAHILEHTTLCGSERYPVRDPFFMMIRRSLNTFMNAFTSSDWTAYPFASQNRKDFNLTIYWKFIWMRFSLRACMNWIFLRKVIGLNSKNPIIPTAIWFTRVSCLMK